MLHYLRRRRGPQRRSLHGFTLIELLVVIAIISLLVSILLPSLNKAKDLAKQTVCATNIRSVMVAFACYANENDGQFTLADGWNPGTLNYDDFIRMVPSGDPVDDGRYYGYWPLLNAQTDGTAITSCEGALQAGSLFCPSDDDFTLHPEDPLQGFPWKDAWAYGHASYAYRGISRRTLSPSDGRHYYYNFGGADTLADPRKPMVIDRFRGGKTGPHFLKYNVGFSDTSVEIVEDENISNPAWSYGWVWDSVDEITGCVTDW